jgi:glycosyltransferase involved in cell wall biosynthesis
MSKAGGGLGATMHPTKGKIVLISKHFGINSGGEAIKGFQFAKHLKARGFQVTVITHQRALDEQGGGAADVDFLIVPDTRLQDLLWRARLELLLDLYFHVAAWLLIRRHVPRSPDVVLHYIAPVSPVTPRFFPRGYRIVLGPLTGNIFYPPAFAGRMTWQWHWASRLHGMAQRLQSVLFPEKRRRVQSVLVSGYERTRESLRLAGVADGQMADVVDAGVSETLYAAPRIVHEGPHSRFAASGRFVDHKGFDLAIRALAATPAEITLEIYGDGEKREELEALVRRLGLRERVRFMGWMPDHEDLLAALRGYRGYVFPSLAEANGIVMQEAMMIGLPVIATRWGGPMHLADEETAIYVDPVSEAQMVAGLAGAMTRLAREPDHAEAISRAARKKAEALYSWDAVSSSWLEAGYAGILEVVVPARR